MARVRSLPPKFWEVDHNKRLNFRQRLLWEGLWTLANDHGKLADEPSVIRSSVFPFDEEGVGAEAVSTEAVDSDLFVLVKESLISRYEVDRKRYILINNWLKWQNPKNPSKDKLPPYPKDNLRIPSSYPTDTLRIPYVGGTPNQAMGNVGGVEPETGKYEGK